MNTATAAQASEVKLQAVSPAGISIIDRARFERSLNYVG